MDSLVLSQQSSFLSHTTPTQLKSEILNVLDKDYISWESDKSLHQHPKPEFDYKKWVKFLEKNNCPTGFECVTSSEKIEEITAFLISKKISFIRRGYLFDLYPPDIKLIGRRFEDDSLHDPWYTSSCESISLNLGVDIFLDLPNLRYLFLNCEDETAISSLSLNVPKLTTIIIKQATPEFLKLFFQELRKDKNVRIETLEIQDSYHRKSCLQSLDFLLELPLPYITYLKIQSYKYDFEESYKKNDLFAIFPNLQDIYLKSFKDEMHISSEKLNCGKNLTCFDSCNLF